MSMAVGSAFANDYQIIEQIGHSSTGTLYKAHEPALARYVAIKVLPQSATAKAGFADWFVQQAEILAALHHIAIPRLYAYGAEQGTAYLVTELIEHRTLATILGTPVTPVSYDFVERSLVPIASALDYAHEAGVIHRNIKPSNILLSSDGRPFLAELGLASLLEGPRDRAAKQTTFGLPLGTPAYMAPESAAGEPFGPATDRYALAVVVYEMLTGRVPFVGATPMGVMLDQARNPPPRPSTINPAIPSAVEDVLLVGLAKDPSQRYTTASAFIAEVCKSGRHVAVAAPAQALPGIKDSTAPVEALPRIEGMPAPAAVAPVKTAVPRRQARIQRRSTAAMPLAGEIRDRLAWILYRFARKLGLPVPILVVLVTVLIAGGVILLIRR